MTAPSPTPATETAPAAPSAPAGAPSAPAAPAYTPPATQADLDALLGKRLNQERAKYGGMSPEEVAALKTQVDAAEAERGSDMEKAVAKAAKDAAAAADAQYRPKLAETAFRVAIGDRKNADEVSDFLADLNLARFINDDGHVDTARVLARVEQFAPSKGAPAAASTPAPRGPVVPGHSAAAAPVKSGDAARAFLAQRGIKVD